MKNEKPIYIFDATPIIHFAKINKLDAILDVCRAYIASEVYREVVERGKAKADALLVENAVKSGRLRLYNVRNRKSVIALLKHPEIHLGEAETIVAARELKGTAVMDDAEGRVIAEAYGVKVATGTLFLLFRLFALKKVGRGEADELLELLVNSGLYLDAQTLIQAKRKLEKAKKEIRG